MKLTAEEWERLFKAYMQHMCDMEGTDSLFEDYQVIELAEAAGVDVTELRSFVANTHREMLANAGR